MIVPVPLTSYEPLGYTVAMEKQQANSNNSSCPCCGNSFSCGVKAGSKTCWCFDLPNIIPMDGLEENGQSYQACLCADCLRELISMRSKSE